MSPADAHFCCGRLALARGGHDLRTTCKHRRCRHRRFPTGAMATIDAPGLSSGDAMSHGADPTEFFCVDEFARILALIFIAPHWFGQLRRTQRIQTPTRGRTRPAVAARPRSSRRSACLSSAAGSLLGDSLRCQLAQPMWSG
jgi:hypothetical protein